MRQYTHQKTLLDAANSTGVGEYANVKDYRTVMIEVAMDAFTGTIQFPISLAEDAPSFGSAQATDNRWGYVQVRDMLDGSDINGGTGVTGSISTDVRYFEVRVKGMKWISANVTAVSNGNVSVRITPFYY